jgi:hypothetical protein
MPCPYRKLHESRVVPGGGSAVARSDLLIWFYATGSGPIGQIRGRPRLTFGLWNGDRITAIAPSPP